MKKILIAALAVVSCASCAAGLALAGNPLGGQAAEWTAVAIEDEYAYGTQFSVPMRSVTADGQTVLAVSVLWLPDGTASTAKQTSLDMTGIWTLRQK